MPQRRTCAAQGHPLPHAHAGIPCRCPALRATGSIEYTTHKRCQQCRPSTPFRGCAAAAAELPCTTTLACAKLAFAHNQTLVVAVDGFPDFTLPLHRFGPARPRLPGPLGSAAHLDGSLPGDAGFDPLGLGTEQDKLARWEARSGRSWCTPVCVSGVVQWGPMHSARGQDLTGVRSWGCATPWHLLTARMPRRGLQLAWAG